MKSKKLILMSDNSINKESVKKELKKLINKDLNLAKVLLVYTQKTEKDKVFLEQVIEDLVRVGILKENITQINISEEISTENLNDFDFIYFCGGNTYYILDRVKKTGFDKFLKENINEGKVYVGVSAGAIILSKDISIAGIGNDPDENEIDLRDLSGLDIINFYVFPHYDKYEEEFIEDFEKSSEINVKRLRDGEVLVVNEKGIIKK